MIGINANFKRTPLKQRKSTVTKDIFIFSNFWQFFNFRKKHTHKLNLATHVNIDRIYIMSKWKGLWIIFNFYGRGAPAKRDFLEKFCQFSSPINLLKMKSVVEKLNVWTVELIFHLVSKNVVVFDAAKCWENAAFTNLFSKSQKWTISGFFFFAPWQRKKEKECATILIVPAAESCLGAMQKHKELAPVATPINWCCTHFYDPIILFIFWCFVVFFDVLDNVINKYLGQWFQNYPNWKNPPLFDICSKFEVNRTSNAPSGLCCICEE